MAVDAISPGRRTGFELTPAVELACFALCVANLALLAAMFMQGSWLVGADGDYPLIYPPTFLFVTTLLALVPYLPAFAAWMLLTFPAYVIGVRRIVGGP